MGLIAELLEWARGTDGDAELADAKCDPGGGDNVTAGHFQGAGIDSHPLQKSSDYAGDYVLLVPGPEVGSYLVAGYVDPNNAGVAKAGEVRLYARDGGGAVVGELHITADGEVPDGIAAELIARADRTDAALNALAAKYNGHVHVTTATVSSGNAGVLDAPLPADAGNEDNNVGCDKVYVT